jgi:hypothetical protein
MQLQLAQNKKLMNSRKKKTIRNNHFKIYWKDYVKLLFVICFVFYVFRKPLIYSPILNFFSTEKIKGYIIDEKNYERRGNLTHKYSYSYEFKYNNAIHTNNSNIRGLNVGDTVTIEFNKYIPFVNRILK